MAKNAMTTLLSGLTGADSDVLKQMAALTPKLGTIAQAPSMGGISPGGGGGHIHANLPGFINPDPSKDPAMSQNRPYSPDVVMNKRALGSLDDLMQRKLPKNKATEDKEKLMQQLYGTKEKPGAMAGAIPNQMLQAGQNLQGQVDPGVLEELAARGLNMQKEENALQHQLAQEKLWEAQMRKYEAEALKAAGAGKGTGKKAGKPANPDDSDIF